MISLMTVKKYMFTAFLLPSTMLTKFLRKGFASEFRERLQKMCKPVWRDDTGISIKNELRRDGISCHCHTISECKGKSRLMIPPPLFSLKKTK